MIALVIAVMFTVVPVAHARKHRALRSQDIGGLAEAGGALYYERVGATGLELWRSDGTSQGSLLKNFPEPDSFPFGFVEAGGATYFLVSIFRFGPDPFSSTITLELWKTDGTTAGTSRVVEIPKDDDDYFFFEEAPHLVALGSDVFFTGYDDATGSEIWRSDGTPAGTGPLKDVFPGPEGSQPSELTRVGSSVFFSADDGVNGQELWKTDGTPAGTQLVKNIRTLGADSDPTGLTDFGGTLSFFASDTANGNGLWLSDGSEAGTTFVKVLPGESFLEFFVKPVASGGLLFFSIDTFDGTQMWRSDGTDGGTFQVADFPFPTRRRGGFFEPLLTLTSVGSGVLFAAGDPIHGGELWKSDGTVTGTGLVRDIRRGSKSSKIYAISEVGGIGYFAAHDGKTGFELWRSDGTELGTQIVKDLQPGKRSSYPHDLTPLGSRLFFIAHDAAGWGLWSSDGRAEGTARL
jgi:ELWxxDGT repeat protein